MQIENEKVKNAKKKSLVIDLKRSIPSEIEKVVKTEKKSLVIDLKRSIPEIEKVKTKKKSLVIDLKRLIPSEIEKVKTEKKSLVIDLKRSIPSKTEKVSFERRRGGNLIKIAKKKVKVFKRSILEIDWIAMVLIFVFLGPLKLTNIKRTCKFFYQIITGDEKFGSFPFEFFDDFYLKSNGEFEEFTAYNEPKPVLSIEEKVKITRKQFKVRDKLAHLKEIKKRKAEVSDNKQKFETGKYSRETGIPERTLRSWEKDDKLKLLLNDADNSKKVGSQTKKLGKVGRKPKFGESYVKLITKFVELQSELEMGVTYEDIAEHVEEKTGKNILNYEISRLLKRAGIVKRVKTNKNKGSIDTEELKKHEELIEYVRNLDMVILIGSDEKPLRKLRISPHTYAKKGKKQISFEDGGRGARTTITLDPGSFCVLKFGKINFCGFCGLGVLMRDGKQGSIPNAWKKRDKTFGRNKKNITREMFVLQSKKGVMKSVLYPKYLEFHLKLLRDSVMFEYDISVEQYNMIPKYYCNDGAPGHNDLVEGPFTLKEFWKKRKEKENLLEWRLPANSTDYTQSGDLGINREIEKIYKPMSREWIKRKPMTPKGHLQMPGKKVLLTWYCDLWGILKKLSDDVVKTSWTRTGIPKDSTQLWKKI